MIADRSLLETLHRSLATQLCAMFMMVALLFFGGATIRQFIAIMFFGLISGTYSSIFNAVPILAGWEDHDLLGHQETPGRDGLVAVADATWNVRPGADLTSSLAFCVLKRWGLRWVSDARPSL